MLVIVDTESGTETAGVPIPAGADDVYLDAARKRLYVGCGEGFLVVFKPQTDPDKLEMLEKIATAKVCEDLCFFGGNANSLPGGATATGDGRTRDPRLPGQTVTIGCA